MINRATGLSSRSLRKELCQKLRLAVNGTVCPAPAYWVVFSMGFNNVILDKRAASPPIDGKVLQMANEC